MLELHGPGTFATVTNDNWRDDPVQEALIIASGIQPSDDLESAIDAILSPGAYTAIVSGKDNTTGVGLVEVYDLSQTAPAKLANISTRAFVGSGSDVVMRASSWAAAPAMAGSRVRGIGPSLTAQGRTECAGRSGFGNCGMARGFFSFRITIGTIILWQASELIAAGLAPADDLESGISTTLPPGTYTALLAGLNDGAGVGLVEVYDRGAPEADEYE